MYAPSRRIVLSGLAAALLLPSAAPAQSKAPLLSKKELHQLIATAKTAADHQKIAAHYRALAAKHEAEAKEHAELAAHYRAHPTPNETKHPNAPDTASHCLTYAEHCRKAAKSMADLAAHHEALAQQLK
jgi:hypothetical protein